MAKAKKPTIKDLTDALQRERADADNIRRRHAEQITSLKDMVKANVVHELLPVIDNFDRALRHVPKDLVNNDYVKGVQGVVKQFEKTLTDIGVERIKTVGAIFDPHLHEAIHMEDGDGTVEVVCEEIQPGYKLGDEVIRHAMVKVRMEDPGSNNMIEDSGIATQSETTEKKFEEEVTGAIMARVGHSVDVLVPEALGAEVLKIVTDGLMVAYNAGFKDAKENLSKGKEE